MVALSVTRIGTLAHLVETAAEQIEVDGGRVAHLENMPQVLEGVDPRQQLVVQAREQPRDLLGRHLQNEGVAVRVPRKDRRRRWRLLVLRKGATLSNRRRNFVSDLKRNRSSCDNSRATHQGHVAQIEAAAQAHLGGDADVSVVKFFDGWRCSMSNGAAVLPAVRCAVAV